MLLGVVALLVAAAAPGAEAEALGKRLAATGILNTMLPQITLGETNQLIAAHPELTAAEIATLRAIGAEVTASQVARLTAAMGSGYARRLSIDELRTLVAFNESETAKHFRQVVPAVTVESMSALGKIDFKGETMAAFCKKTGKACK